MALITPQTNIATRLAIQKSKAVLFNGLTPNGLIYSDESLLKSLSAATNGQIPIGSTGNPPTLATLTGTTDQVNIANAAGSITLSTPQDIATDSSVTFGNVTDSGLTVNRVTFAGASGLLSDSANLTFASNVLSVIGTTKLGDGGTTNYINFATDGTLTLYGTARVLKEKWIAAGGIKAPGAKPATAVSHGVLETPAWRFADQAVQANEETVSFNLKIPDDMDRSAAPTLCIGWSTTTTDPGNDSQQVEWQLEYLYTQLDESTAAAAEETLYATSTASTVAEGLVTAEFTGINLPHADDVCMHCRIKRLSSATANGGAESDTIADDVELHGIVYIYTVNKLGTDI